MDNDVILPSSCLASIYYLGLIKDVILVETCSLGSVLGPVLLCCLPGFAFSSQLSVVEVNIYRNFLRY